MFLTSKPLFQPPQTVLNSPIHTVDNTQQLIFTIIYLKTFVLAAVALPSYTCLRSPLVKARRLNHENEAQ